MSDERKKVLALVAEGKITPEQADELIEAMEAADDPQLSGESPGADRFDNRVAFARSIASRHEIDPESIREIAREARNLRREVSLQFAGETWGHREVSGNPKIEDMIRLSKYGISPDYVRRLKAAGLTNLTLDQVVKAGKYGIDPDMIAAWRDKLSDELDFDQFVALAKYGISPDYVDRVKAAGINELSFEDVVRMGKYGVDPAWIAEFEKLGLEDFRGVQTPSECE